MHEKTKHQIVSLKIQRIFNPARQKLKKEVVDFSSNQKVLVWGSCKTKKVWQVLVSLASARAKKQNHTKPMFSGKKNKLAQRSRKGRSARLLLP